MRAVNLLPADAYVAKPKLPYAKVVLAGTVPVLAGALVYLGYSLEHSKVTDRQIALGVIDSQVAALSPSQALISQANHVANERALRETELSDALGKQIPWDIALHQIARVLPANVWLSTLQAASPTPAASAGGPSAMTTFSIQGFTYTSADVAHTLARLQLLPSLSNVALSSTAQQLVGQKTVVQFTITANVTGATP
jgi:Tfp pilus assembly protein PilN